MFYCDKTKEIDYVFELCKQLHQQYAEADNNKTNSIIGFIGAIAFVFTGYGYAILNCYNNPLVVNLISVVANVIICSITLLVINFGATQRRDQIIVERIRRLFFNCSYKSSWSEAYEYIFSDRYKSVGKNLTDFLPNHYHIMYYSLLAFQLLLIVFSFIYNQVEFDSIYRVFEMTIKSWCYFYWLFIFLLFLVPLFYHHYKFKKYEEASVSEL